MSTTTEPWRRTWREALAPLLPQEGLLAMRRALAEDSTELLQGSTTKPAPFMCMQDWPVEAACAMAYPFWKDGLNTVGEVEAAFSRACFEVDKALGEAGGCMHFMKVWDDTPREKMFPLLLAEVDRTLALREHED